MSETNDNLIENGENSDLGWKQVQFRKSSKSLREAKFNSTQQPKNPQSNGNSSEQSKQMKEKRRLKNRRRSWNRQRNKTNNQKNKTENHFKLVQDAFPPLINKLNSKETRNIQTIQHLQGHWARNRQISEIEVKAENIPSETASEKSIQSQSVSTENAQKMQSNHNVHTPPNTPIENDMASKNEFPSNTNHNSFFNESSDEPSGIENQDQSNSTQTNSSPKVPLNSSSLPDDPFRLKTLLLESLDRIQKLEQESENMKQLISYNTKALNLVWMAVDDANHKLLQKDQVPQRPFNYNMQNNACWPNSSVSYPLQIGQNGISYYYPQPMNDIQIQILNGARTKVIPPSFILPESTKNAETCTTEVEFPNCEKKASI